MQTISLAFTDFGPDFTAETCPITRVLRRHVTVKILDPAAEEQPQLLVYSVWGQEHLRYDCLSLFVADGDILPDFNLCDYAIGPDALQLADRYFRLSPCRAHLCRSDLVPRDAAHFVEAAKLKTRFCNFHSMDADSTDSMGERFFDVLCAHERVDSGGSLRNNLDGVILDKVPWQRQYKFSIVFESALREDYSTQAMLDALRADTIPIYWGNPQAGRFFNPARFINVHDYASLADAARQVCALHKDPDAYIQTLTQPWFAAEADLHLPEEDAALNAFLRALVLPSPQDATAVRRVRTGGLVPQYKAQRRRAYRLLPMLDKLQSYKENMGKQAQQLEKKFLSGLNLRSLQGFFRKKSDR